MKKIFFCILFIFSFENLAFSQDLIKDLQQSLALTKSNGKAGIKSCLYAFQHFANPSLNYTAANLPLKTGFTNLDKLFSDIKENHDELYENTCALLLEHYNACLKKYPLEAIQFLMLYDNFYGDGIINNLSSNEKFNESFRKMLLENGYITLYHYYSQSDFHEYDDRNDGEKNYELFEKYGWLEQTEFNENFTGELPVLELGNTLALLTSHIYYDSFQDIIQNTDFNLALLAKKENWNLEDLLIIWYHMMEDYEKGIFSNALYYGELGKKAKIPDKYKYYYYDFLEDYSLVISSVFANNTLKLRDDILLDLSKNKYLGLVSQITKLENDASHGVASKAELDNAATLLEKEREKFKANENNYLLDFWYDFDLRMAELYKEFGYKDNALFYVSRLKKLSQISLKNLGAYHVTTDDYIELHISLAHLYYGLTDQNSFDEERKIIENTFSMFKDLDGFQEDGQINFADLTARIKTIANVADQIGKQKVNLNFVDSITSVIQLSENNSFCEVSAILPIQFNDSLFIPAQTVKRWLSTPVANKFSDPFLEKYSTIGYPLMYGVNKINLFNLFQSYHDFLNDVNLISDFEPWYEFVIEMHKKINYAIPLSYEQFENDFFMANLYLEKYYLDKADMIFNKWQQHCLQLKDTTSIIYAYTMAGKIQVLTHKNNSSERLSKTIEYFDLVKSRGNCSQCYILAALQVADAYLENKDTVNTRKTIYDLIQKSNTGENIPNDLKSDVWQNYLDLLITRLVLEEQNSQKREEILTQIDNAVEKGKNLWREDEYGFLLIQKWTEIERNILDRSATLDLIWKDYLKSHINFSEKQAYFTDRDRQVYFESLLNTQNILTWRYALTAAKENEYAARVFEYTMYYKSLSSGTNAEIKKFILHKKDSVLTEKWNELLNMRSHSFTTGSSNDFKEYQLEKELLLAMINDSIKTSYTPVSTALLQEKLDNKSYLVNIVRSENHLNNKIIYFAQVLSKNNNIPQYVFLGDGKMLEETGWNTYEKLIKTPDNSKTDTSSFGVFWKKLNTIIPPGSKVYVMNDGVYHKINLSSIYDAKTKKYLANEYEFRYISDISTFGKPSGSFGKLIKAEIFGNPTFKIGDFNTDITINQLDNTQTECEAIFNIINTSNTYYAEEGFHTGANANEEALKSIESPDILHIASHGFFVPSIKDEKELPEQKVFSGDVTFRSATIDFSATSDPLLRSGILLSGCSNTLNGHEIDAFYGRSQEDGILTAKELMQINLDSTKLVVMSACETGLGDIIPGQGIAGLQKGFKTAGAEYMVLTLWSVDDLATREFMELFYKEITKNIADINCIETSFFSAQNKFKSNPKFQHPFFWGAFVLVK